MPMADVGSARATYAFHSDAGDEVVARSLGGGVQAPVRERLHGQQRRDVDYHALLGGGLERAQEPRPAVFGRRTRGRVSEGVSGRVGKGGERRT